MAQRSQVVVDDSSPVPAAGQLLFADSATSFKRLSPGDAGKVLTSAGAGLPPTWETPASGAELTAQQVGFGSPANLLTGKAGFEFDPVGDILSVPIVRATSSLRVRNSGFDAAISASLTANRAITLPDAAGKVVIDGATQTLTGKTLVNPALTGPLCAAIGPDADSQHALPNVAADTVALLAATQTLTGKTLTSPTINDPSIGGTITASKFIVSSNNTVNIDCSGGSSFQLQGNQTSISGGTHIALSGGPLNISNSETNINSATIHIGNAPADTIGCFGAAGAARQAVGTRPTDDASALAFCQALHDALVDAYGLVSEV